MLAICNKHTFYHFRFYEFPKFDMREGVQTCLKTLTPTLRVVYWENSKILLAFVWQSSNLFQTTSGKYDSRFADLFAKWGLWLRFFERKNLDDNFKF